LHFVGARGGAAPDFAVADYGYQAWTPSCDQGEGGRAICARADCPVSAIAGGWIDAEFACTAQKRGFLNVRAQISFKRSLMIANNLNPRA
jgi:hypothetical protein